MIHVSEIKNGRQLFWLRFIQQLQFLLKMWKLAVDWIVWIYIVIPAIGIAIFFYVTLWLGTAEWANYIHGSFIPFIFLIQSFGGVMKSYLKEADILFLWQERKIIKELQSYGLIFFLILSFLRSMMTFIVLAPILIVYLDWSLLTIIEAFLFLTIYNIFFTLVKRELYIRKSKWVFRGWMALFVIAAGILFYLIVPILNRPLILIVSVLAGFLGMVYMVNRMQSQMQHFYREIEIEIEKKAKSVQLFFSQLWMIGGPEFLTEKIKSSSRKRPFLFRKSRKLFKEYSANTGYMELFIKSVLRNKSWLLIYFQFLGASLFAILIVPEYVKWVLWLLMTIVIGNTVKVFLVRVLDHPFLKVVAWPKMDQKKMAFRCIIMVLAPAGLILSLWFGFLVFKLWGLVFGLLAAFILIPTVSKFFATKAVN